MFESRYHNISVIVGIGVFLLISCLFVSFIAPGYLSIDEVTYHLMTKNVSEGRFVEILNGYHESPSKELQSASLFIHANHLVAIPPVLYPIIATPIYWLMGFKGLFLLNFLAFAGILVTTFGIARYYLKDTSNALLSCFLLGTATYLSDYAVAAWPHAISCLCIVLSFRALIRAGIFEVSPARVNWVFLSGLCLGIGVGMRYDTIFMLPALLIPIVLRRPFDFICVVSFFSGLAPTLILLCFSNWYKFGDFTPFSYGINSGGLNVASYKSFMGLAIIAIVMLSVCPVHYFRRLLLTALAVISLVLLFSEMARQIMYQFFHGSYQLLIDFRIRDMSINEPALTRGPGGSLVYYASLKKTLIQSMPWLPLLILPLIGLFRKHEKPFNLLTFSLFLPLVCFFTPYAFFAWHGGLSLNLRYYIPLLPFICILAANAWSELFPAIVTAPWKRRTNILIILTLLVIIVSGVTTVYLTIKSPEQALKLQEAIYLSGPMLLALALCLSLLFMLSGVKAELTRAITWLLLIACITWSFGVTFTYDIPRSSLIRKVNFETAEEIAPLIKKDAIVFTPFVDSIYGLINYSDVRIANPGRDDFADFNRLATYHIKRGRGAYAALKNSEWNRLESENLLQGLSTQLLLETPVFTLKELKISSSKEQYLPILSE